MFEIVLAITMYAVSYIAIAISTRWRYGFCEYCIAAMLATSLAWLILRAVQIVR